VSISADDLRYLRRCVELARKAADEGNRPFGSLLVDADGNVAFEDHNRTADGDHTRHPEFEIARWAANNVAPVQRVRATVYTSGEHCPMCAAAHGWVGLGRIVYAVSTEQLVAWQSEWGLTSPPVNPLPINAVAPRVPVDGPAPELADEMKALYAAAFRP
jgi:tRNA(Arg) A34 adenosine deaminase TadA